MGKNLEKNKLNFYQKKRRLILFFLIATPLVLFGSFIGLYFSSVDNNILYGIYLVVGVLYLFLLIYLKGKFQTYDIYFQYLLMLKNKREPYKLHKKIFTDNWLLDFKRNDFKLEVDNHHFQLYSKYYKKSYEAYLIKQTLVLIVIAKHELFDFYSEDINREIERIDYQKNKIRKQVVLQFKRYSQLNEENINQIEQIINYKEGKNQLIHITAGYFDKTNQLYFLEPKKKYPSKHYFFGCQLIKQFAYINEDNHEKRS